MGRMLLILIMGGGMLFSLANLNINNSIVNMSTNTIQEYEKTQAKDFARSGIDIAIKNLTIDTTYTGDYNKALTNGSVTIIVENTTSQFYNGNNVSLVSARLITSIGFVGGQTDTIRTVIQLPTSSSNPVVPPFLNYAVAMGGNMTLNGNVSIRDNNNPQLNANIHTNSNFQMNGNNTITGFLTYSGTATSNPSSRLKTNIVPNQNPQNLPSTSQAPNVNMPSFNPDNYKGQAGQTYSSNANLNGEITLGTKSNPEIIYVNGDLNLSGNTTISGYGMFIVKGNILVNGNVTTNSSDDNESEDNSSSVNSSVGLYCTGDLNANGNVKLNAQIYTGGNVNLNGNVTLYGSVTASGVVNFNGNNKVYYIPSNAALTKPFWPQNNNSNNSTRPSVMSYLE